MNSVEPSVKTTMPRLAPHNLPANITALLARLQETEQQKEDLRALLVPLRELVAKAA